MGRRRAKRRPPTPSSSEEDEEELILQVGAEEEGDDESENEEEELEELMLPAGPENEEELEELMLPVGPENEEEGNELMLLPVGAEVEVRSDDPGFAGSFYEATVAGHLLSDGSARGRYTVAYSTLLADDGGEPLRETALAANVRPRPPPPPKEREFAVHDMVEAFHSDGWWAGVVSAVVQPPVMAGNRLQTRAYMVTFPTWRQTLEVGETDLRPHRVFKAGRWVPASEVDNGSPLFSKGNQVEVSAKYFGASWSPATVLKVIGGASYFLVQHMNVGKNGELVTEIVESQDIRPERTITRMESKYRFSPSHVEVHHEGSWWPGAIVEVLGNGIHKKYVVKLKNHNTDMEDMEPVDALTVEYPQLRPQFDWDGTKWLLHEKYVHEMNPFQKSYNGPRSTSRKRTVYALYDDADQISNEPDSHSDKKLKVADLISQQISPVLSIRNGESSSQMIGIPSMQQSQQLHASLFKEFGQPFFRSIEGSQKVELNDQGEHSTIGTGTQLSRQVEECICSQTEVDLGENPETPMKGIAAKAIEEDKNVISLSADLSERANDVTAGRGILRKVNTPSCIDWTPQRDIRGSQEGSGIKDLQQGGYAGDTNVEPDTGGELGQRYLVMADNANFRSLPSENSCEATVHDNQLWKDNTAAEVECVTGCVAPDENLWLESVGVHESILDTNDWLSESLAIQKHLPFVKTSPMWAQLEALEIFRKAPQRPHFRQFEQYCPELREGMALGLMLSFANLAESINRLDGLDDKGPLEQKMKGLASLEENGFDVRDLRSRMQTLVATNKSCVKPRKMIEEEIAHKETEDRELGTQVGTLSMAVHRLELHAHLMGNKMQSAVTQKMNNAIKISRLKARANDLERSYVSNAVPRSVWSTVGACQHACE